MRNTWGAAFELLLPPTPPLDFHILNDSGEEVRGSSFVRRAPLTYLCIPGHTPLSSLWRPAAACLHAGLAHCTSRLHPAPLSPFAPPDLLPQVEAGGVIDAVSGTSEGAFGSRKRYPTQAQFAVTDPAVQQVGF